MTLDGVIKQVNGSTYRRVNELKSGFCEGCVVLKDGDHNLCRDLCRAMNSQGDSMGTNRTYIWINDTEEGRAKYIARLLGAT